MNRKIIGGAAAVIAALALVGTGTYAYFVDTEVSADQSLEAGTLDLVPGNFMSSPAIAVEDVAPGDSDSVSFNLSNAGSIDGDLSLEVVSDQDSENTCTEPEGDDEPDCGLDGVGELDDNLDIVISRGVTPVWSGTLAALAADLDGQAFGLLADGTSATLTVAWSIDESVDNRIQSDEAEFHIVATLDQAV